LFENQAKGGFFLIAILKKNKGSGKVAVNYLCRAFE
jgi:hypothetical protein